MDIAEKLSQARVCLESGDVAGGEQWCRSVLDESPDCADALHFLAVARLQSGRPDEAVEHVRQAIAAAGASPLYLNTLGVGLAGMRKFDEAVVPFRQAIALDPRFADGHHNLAKALRASGHLKEAADCYRAAIGLRPEGPEIHYDLGNTLRAMNRFDEAVASYREAVRLRPDYIKAYTNLGGTLRELKRFGEADECYRQIVRYRPDDGQGYLHLAGSAMRRKAYAEAEQHYRKALELDADRAAARAGLAKAVIAQDRLDEAAKILDEADSAETSDEKLLEARLRLSDKLRLAERHDEAVSLAQQVLEIKPDYALAFQSLGLGLAARGDLTGAVAAYHRAIEIRPDAADVHNNLGVAEISLGNDEEALHHLDTALRICPDLAVAHLNRSVLRLRLGDFATGWPEYEWRRLCPDHRLRTFDKPLWLGQPIPDGTLLLHSEQGLGDTIQFIRYAALARQRVGTLIVACQRPLLRVLSRCSGIDRLIADKTKLPDHDAQLPMASLPLVFQTRPDTIPADVPYVFPDEEVVAAWRNRLAEYREFKVGIAWQGSTKYAGDATRSLPLRHFAPLAAVEGVRLFSLQKGYGVEQLTRWDTTLPVIDLGPDLDTVGGSFMDTAAVVQNLDLVISSDTSIVHLVGAMGRPLWLLLSTSPDWRWLTGREDNPWYPTMRLFRQSRLGDWDELLGRVAAELRQVVEGDTDRLRPAAHDRGVLQHTARSLPGKPSDTTQPPLVVPPFSGGPISLEAPLAPGELFDRLSILQIKLDRIASQEKLAHVREEHDRLESVRRRAIRPSPELLCLVEELRSVNQQLWDIEDAIRVCGAADDFGPRFIELARSVYETNDRRAAIKREINTLLDSPIAEQKQYTHTATSAPAGDPRTITADCHGGRSASANASDAIGEVLYINLTRRPERKELFLKVNSGCAEFRRVEAVDGQELTNEDLIRRGAIREPLRHFTAGALGAALSHHKIWQECVAQGKPVTVAEDDAVFNRSFVRKAGEVLSNLPSEWDFVLWGWNFDSILNVEVIGGLRQSVMRFDAGYLRDRIAEFQATDYDVLPMRLIGAFGTVCYSISPKGAGRLSELCFPLRNETIRVPGLGRDIPNLTLDSLMNKHYRRLKSYAAFPPLVWTENDKSISDVSRSV